MHWPRVLALLLAWALIAFAQPALANHVAAELVPEAPATPGTPVTLALHFTPEPGWHGYWSNPGDAGYGLDLKWHLPDGWKAGEPQYPVPQMLSIGEGSRVIFHLNRPTSDFPHFCSVCSGPCPFW